MSLISRFKGSEHIEGIAKSGDYADKAQCLIGYISGEADLEVLQAVSMLQVYRASTGEWETATSLHAIACRIVCGLGGHFHQPAKPYDPLISHAERRIRHIRTLFWLSYVFDKDISLRSGQPPLLIDDYCDLTLPENYTSRYDPLVSSDHDMINDSITYEGLVPYLPGDIGLSRVKEKACLLLYSPKTFSLDDCQLLLNIRHLDNELENWRSSIPSEYRPRLTIQPGFPLFPPEMSMPQRMRHVKLQLEYHYLVTAIHTAVRRCGKAYAEVTDLPEDLHSVFHSSSDLSLEASRSTLVLLKSHLESLEDGGFWLVAFYPPVAAMSLFMNIVLHPLDSQAKVDLEILASSVSIFQNFSVEALTDYEIECIQEMNNFVVELVRLGNCAIWKARREASQEVL
ncbi:hypothetical protein FDECE_12256 [Fusarium decemcellulare]|nr:hypothetical protein FDECE_12256 [Fusarium decemcellulare]